MIRVILGLAALGVILGFVAFWYDGAIRVTALGIGIFLFLLAFAVLVSVALGFSTIGFFN